jgi:hypothetical protein
LDASRCAELFFSVLLEMELCAEHSWVRFKQRAVITFLTEEGVAPIEIHRRMQLVYGDCCVDVIIARR